MCEKIGLRAQHATPNVYPAWNSRAHCIYSRADDPQSAVAADPATTKRRREIERKSVCAAQSRTTIFNDHSDSKTERLAPDSNAGLSILSVFTPTYPACPHGRTLHHLFRACTAGTSKFLLSRQTFKAHRDGRARIARGRRTCLYFTEHESMRRGRGDGALHCRVIGS